MSDEGNIWNIFGDVKVISNLLYFLQGYKKSCRSRDLHFKKKNKPLRL